MLGLLLLLLLQICFRGVRACRPSFKSCCPKGFVSEMWHYLFGLHEHLKSHQMALCSKVDSGRHRGGQGVQAGGVEVFIWSVDTRASSQYQAEELQLLVHSLSKPQMRLHSKVGEDVETKSRSLACGLGCECLQPSPLGKHHVLCIEHTRWQLHSQGLLCFDTMSLGQHFQESSSAERSCKTHAG